MNKILALLMTLIIYGNISAETVTVTLSNAIELSLRNNLMISKTEKEIEIAEAQYGETMADFAMPAITGSASFTELDPMTVKDGITIFPIPPAYQSVFNFPPITNVYADNYHAGISLTKPLFTGFKLWNSLAVRKANLDLARAKLRDQKLEVISDVTSSFYSLFLIRENMKMQEDLNNSLHDHMIFTSNSYASGNATEYDFIRARVQYKLSLPKLTDLSNSYANQKLSFCQKIGIYDPSSIEIVGSLLDTTNISLPISNKDEIMAMVLSNDINILGIDTAIKIAKLSKEISEGNMSPVLAAFFNYGYDLSKTNSFAAIDRTWNSSWSAGLQLSMSFDSLIPYASKRWNTTMEAQKNVENLEVQRSIAANAIALQVQSLLLQLEEGKENILVLQDNVDQAKLGYRLADLRYKAGNSTEIEVIDAEVSVVEAETSWLKSIFDYYSSNIRLKRLIGDEKY